MRRVLAPGPWLPAPLLLAAGVASVAGCVEIDGRDPPARPTPGERTRTVDLELMRTFERRMLTDADGMVSYAPPVPVGGVEVCVIAQRAAFESFEPFEDLDRPLCVVNEQDETTLLPGLPADADLLVTHVKAGFRSLLTTFRTDAHDVALPDWVGEDTYFLPLLPSADELPVDAEADALGARGTVAVWVEAVGEYTIGSGPPRFYSVGDFGVAPAHGVTVAVGEDQAGEPALAVTTRRDRPSFLSLPPGSHRLRFAHAALELVPLGVQEQYMIMGLPTDRFDTVEVPVREGFLTLAMSDGYCPLPADPTVVFEDLSTCTIGASASASAAADGGVDGSVP